MGSQGASMLTEPIWWSLLCMKIEYVSMLVFAYVQACKSKQQRMDKDENGSLVLGGEKDMCFEKE